MMPYASSESRSYRGSGVDGFEEFIVLSARRSGKLLGVALWENEGVVVLVLRLLRVSRAHDAPL